MVRAALLAVLLLLASSAFVATAGRTTRPQKQGAPAVAAMERGCEGADDEDGCITAAARRMLRAPPAEERAAAAAMEGGCEGAADEDKCMERQTLDALSDDVYTEPQHNNESRGGSSAKP
ncbi:hypothetical protein ACP70R_014566 [Stipagrostis hirtigluma subsp. patula]